MMMWQKSLINLLAFSDIVHTKYLLTYLLHEAESFLRS